MADSTAIAITSLIVGGIATVAGPTAAALLQARRDRDRVHYEERTRDVVELRRLLDEAAMELDTLNDRLYGIVREYVDSAPYNNPDLPDLDDEAAMGTPRLRQLKAQLAIRLGRAHGAVTALTDAINAADARLEAIGPLVMEKVADDRESLAAPTAYIREEEVSADAVHTQALDAYRSAEDRFLDAAQGLAGTPVVRD